MELCNPIQYSYPKLNKGSYRGGSPIQKEVLQEKLLDQWLQPFGG